MGRVWLKIFAYGLLCACITATAIIVANKEITLQAEKFTSGSIDRIPDYSTGLLLGTSKHVVGGGRNLYFEYRIQAAVDLFQSGKVKNLIVSGDNGTKEYNEPQQMKNVLVERGIPEDKIYLDYAGFRTFDSVVRAKEIFGQEKIIVISQKFQNERAIFIAQKKGIEAFGYNAKDVNSYAGFKTNIREYFARVKVFIDLLLNAKPKFLGEKVIIQS